MPRQIGKFIAKRSAKKRNGQKGQGGKPVELWHFYELSLVSFPDGKQLLQV